MESLFRPQDYDLYGNNQARAIAGSQQRSQQAQRGMADFESSLTRQDIQAQQQGEEQFAQARTQQLQTIAQRESAIKEAELQAEAELQRRKQQLASKVGKMAGTIAGLAGAGPLGAAAIGGAGGFLGSGGQAGGAFSGATTGALTAYQVGQDAGEVPEQETPEDSLLLAQKSTAGIGARGMEADIPENPSAQLGQGPSSFGDNVVQGQSPTPQGTGASSPTTGAVNETVGGQTPLAPQYDFRQFQQEQGFDAISRLFGDAQPESEMGVEDLSFEQFQELERRKAMETGMFGGGQMDQVGSLPSSFGEAGQRFGESFQGFVGDLNDFRRFIGFETQEERYRKFNQ